MQHTKEMNGNTRIQKTIEKALKKVHQNSSTNNATFNQLFHRIINSGEVHSHNLTPQLR